LRKLFDNICEKPVGSLNEEIEQLRRKLIEQRNELKEVAIAINELTSDGSPLTEYISQKMRYEEVNQPEVKHKYQEIDHVLEIDKILNNAEIQWADIVKEMGLGNAKEKISTFFDSLGNDIRKEKPSQEEDSNRVDEESAINEKSFLKSLLILLDQTEEESKPSPMKRVLVAIKTLEKEFQSVAGLLKKAKADTSKRLKEISDALGQPIGAKDRETKKHAWEKAKEYFTEYKKLWKEWQELIEQRGKIFSQLQQKCKERTQRRIETARWLSENSIFATLLNRNILKSLHPIFKKSQKIVFSDSHLVQSQKYLPKTWKTLFSL